MTAPLIPANEGEVERVLIWSGEHHAYWRPNSAGYTIDGLGAGLYPRDEAERIVAGTGPDKKIELRPINPAWPIVAALSTPAQSGETRNDQWRAGAAWAIKAARREVRAALHPTNPESDWTEWAKDRAEASRVADTAIAALSPDTSKVGAVDVREAQDRNREKLVYAISTFCDNITLPGEDGDAAYDLLRQAAAQIGSDRLALQRPPASPPPVEAGMVIAALSRRNGMMTSGSLARPNMTISFAMLEECNEAYDAIRSAAPKDMEEGR